MERENEFNDDTFYRYSDTTGEKLLLLHNVFSASCGDGMIETVSLAYGIHDNWQLILRARGQGMS